MTKTQSSFRFLLLSAFFALFMTQLSYASTANAITITESGTEFSTYASGIIALFTVFIAGSIWTYTRQA